MAALNFPPSPSTNQIYSANGKSWRFDGTSWKTFYILNVQGGGTGNTSYNLGDILVGAGTSLYPFPVGSNSLDEGLLELFANFSNFLRNSKYVKFLSSSFCFLFLIMVSRDVSNNLFISFSFDFSFLLSSNLKFD
jgi:hypothetical protein